MELLRRALLVGCVLPGLWLLRLAPLDPVLSIAPFDFAARQKQEAAAIPDAMKTEAQRRQAEIPLSVYIEEFLQFNVFSATGVEWERFLESVDRSTQAGSAGARVFYPKDAPPLDAVSDKLAAAGGTTYISLSRPGGDVHYQVVRHQWTRDHFTPWAGFTGKPAPPAGLLYPFRALGYAAAVAGVVLFLLWPRRTRSGLLTGITPLELLALAIGLTAFAVPLIATGGSIQSLTRGFALTLACWAITLVGVHLFASPGRTAPDLTSAPASSPSPEAAVGRYAMDLMRLREGAVFLAMTLMPTAFLIAASLILWNH